MFSQVGATLRGAPLRDARSPFCSVPSSFAGRPWSRDLLKELPTGIDPCGENGEIHTIVIGGPMFGKRIEVEIGEIVQRDGFAYADIIPMG